MCESDMNVTLSLDKRLAERARKVAASLGKSLNQMIRDYLEQVSSSADAEHQVEELRHLSEKAQGRSRGWRFDRDELHERSQLS